MLFLKRNEYMNYMRMKNALNFFTKIFIFAVPQCSYILLVFGLRLF